MEERKNVEMDKVFNPKAVEDRLYAEWEQKGYFKGTKIPGKKPFVIMMPPPNITGQLHMGHAMDALPQDALIRYHRMKGDPTLWLPGTDHAAIATEGAKLAQEIVENELVMGTDAYKNGNIVYLAHPAVWYTAEGGITALDIMLQDLETELTAA